MLKLSIFSSFLLLCIAFSQAAIPKCDSACSDGLCEAVCYGLEEDSLCMCDQRPKKDMYNYMLSYVGKDTRDWSCSGTGCGDWETNAPAEITLDDCKAHCAADENCQSFVWKSVPFTSFHTCELLSGCKSVEEASEIDECHLCAGSMRKCVTCPMISFEAGPTAIHYQCSAQGDFDAYHDELPEGTLCKPTHSCADPEVDKDATITCTMNEAKDGGEWKTADATVADPAALDQQCTCPELLVAYSPGTGIFCEDMDTTEVQDDQGVLLKSGNTCILTCDGHFVSELACKFNNKGTVWYSNMEYFDPQEVSGCISCNMDACPKDDSTTTEASKDTTKPTTKPDDQTTEAFL